MLFPCETGAVTLSVGAGECSWVDWELWEEEGRRAWGQLVLQDVWRGAKAMSEKMVSSQLLDSSRPRPMRVGSAYQRTLTCFEAEHIPSVRHSEGEECGVDIPP